MSTASQTTGATSYENHVAQMITWNLAAGESGDPINMMAYADRSVHIFGTFNGATVTFEGSNEPDTPTPANFGTLHDGFSNLHSYTAPVAPRGVHEMVRLARPKVTGGDGGTAITVILFVKR